MLARSTFAVTLACALGAQALSTQCIAQIGSLAILGEIGQCLQLRSALDILQSSGSVVNSVDTYLTSLCASSTPTCSDSALSGAQQNIQSACASDISAGGTDAAQIGILQSLIEDYPNVRAGACSRNATTNQYCVVNILSTVQNTTGQDVTTDFVAGLLSGSNTDAFTSSLASGQLCTDCVEEIYYQARQANESIASTTLGQGLSNQCGANFGMQGLTSATQQSDVAASSAATSGSAATSSAASSSGAAISGKTLSLAPYAMAGMTLLLGGAIGGVMLV